LAATFARAATVELSPPIRGLVVHCHGVELAEAVRLAVESIEEEPWERWC
jgi:hypothetical protein